MTKYFFSPSIRKLVGKEPPENGWRSYVLKTAFKGLAILFGVIFFWFSLLVVLSQSYVLEVALGLMPSQTLSGVNVLVYGIDDTRRVQRSDTIILVHLSDSAQHLSALSIPRDTRLTVPGIGMTKVNHAYAHGGDSLLKTSVSQFLDVPIHHSVKVNLSGVEKLIDAIGGVSVDVPKHLKYEDLAGNLSIDIPRGRRLLSGKEAVNFLRFRQDRNGDIGRIQRQQLFLKEMMDQTLSTGTFFRLPSIVWSLRQLIQSDLSMLEMVGLAKRFSSTIKRGQLNKLVLPGRVGVVNGVSYWLSDTEGLKTMMAKDFYNIQEKKPVRIASRPTISDPEELLPDDSYQQSTLIISQEELLPDGAEVELPPEPAKPKRKKRKPKPRPTKTKPPEPVAQPIVTKPAPKPKPVAPIVKTVIRPNLKQHDLQVEILNGYGKAGEAGKAAALVRSFGVTIFKAHNSKRFDYTETKLVDWKGNTKAAKDVAASFFIDPKNIVVYDRPTKQIDFTIVLGADWETIKDKLGKNQ